MLSRALESDLPTGFFGKGPAGRFDTDLAEAKLGQAYAYECAEGENPRAVRQNLGHAAKRTKAEIETKVVGTVVYWRIVSREGDTLVNVGGGRPPVRQRPGATSPGRTGAAARSKGKGK
jgi:hypothetical protein